ARIGQPDAGWLLGARYGQAAEEQAVEQGEHGRVRPYSDGQGEDRGQAEDGAAPKRAQPVAEVAEQSLQPHEDVAVAGIVPLEQVTAETALRFAARRLRRRARRDELVRTLGELEGQLALDLFRDFVRAKHVTEAR